MQYPQNEVWQENTWKNIPNIHNYGNFNENPVFQNLVGINKPCSNNPCNASDTIMPNLDTTQNIYRSFPSNLKNKAFSILNKPDVVDKSPNNTTATTLKGNGIGINNEKVKLDEAIKGKDKIKEIRCYLSLIID